MNRQEHISYSSESNKTLQTASTWPSATADAKHLVVKVTQSVPDSLLSRHSHMAVTRCTFQFLGGCQGRRTGVGVTTVSNSLILGGWVTKVLKNDDKK